MMQNQVTTKSPCRRTGADRQDRLTEVEALTYKNDRQRAELTFEHHISKPVFTVFPQLPLPSPGQ